MQQINVINIIGMNRVDRGNENKSPGDSVIYDAESW